MIPQAKAQDNGYSLQQDAGRKIAKEKQRKFITLSIENDMFGKGTDRNYTSGVRLSYFDLGTQLPDFAYTLDRVVPTFSINETTSIYYTLGHNLYTPSDIERVTQDPNERPWAAFLYASAGMMSITDNHIDELEATLGVIGPLALGEQIQKAVHKVVNSPKPRGWRNQLKNEPALMLSWQRSFPERIDLEAYGWHASAVPHIGATIGNVYTYANIGASFRLSPENGRWQDVPPRVRPAMPGTGAFVTPDDDFSWHFFGGIEGRAMAQNIFLDGNTFRNSHSVDKKPFVLDATAGIATTYDKVRISYTAIYRTREYHEQDSGDLFGSISLGVRF